MTMDSLNIGVIAVGIVWAILFSLKQYFRGGECRSNARLDGKLIIITGCNTGIGKETALDLTKRGGKIIMACRDPRRANKAAADIRREANVSDDMVIVEQLNLSSLKSVREFADKINKREQKVDILINNAGVMWTPHVVTEDGNEQQFQVNHLSHFLLTNLLLDKLKAAPSARIVNLSSLGHLQGKMNIDDLNATKSYDRYSAYFQSKLANVMFTRSLAKRLKGTNVTAYSLHPGAVDTELARDTPILKYKPVYNTLYYLFMWALVKTSKEGAQTSINCAVEPSLANESGKYYSDCAEAKVNPIALDDSLAEKLWSASEKLVGLSK